MYLCAEVIYKKVSNIKKDNPNISNIDAIEDLWDQRHMRK